MSLTRYSPGWDPFDEIDDVMRRLPTLRNSSVARTGFVPAVDMYETDSAVMVKTPLAGIDPKDIKVSVENGVLTISGEHKKEHEVDEKNYYRKEIRSGEFHRRIALPTAVQEDDVAAEFSDGILQITCPKTAPVKSKKVDVKVVKKGKKK